MAARHSSGHNIVETHVRPMGWRDTALDRTQSERASGRWGGEIQLGNTVEKHIRLDSRRDASQDTTRSKPTSSRWNSGAYKSRRKTLGNRILPTGRRDTDHDITWSKSASDQGVSGAQIKTQHSRKTHTVDGSAGHEAGRQAMGGNIRSKDRRDANQDTTRSKRT